MTDSTAISAELWLDRGLIWTGGDSVRYLVVGLKAKPAAQDRSGLSRRSHNLGFVIDRSQSMAGPALTAAKQFVKQVVRQLDHRDTVSVVAFDRTQEVLAAGVRMDATGQRAVETALAGINPVEGSELFEGWLRGAEQVASLITNPGDQMSRLFVISDGRDSAATERIGYWAQHARALADRGLPTSSLGIGTDTNPSTLVALDDRQGEWLYTTEDPGSLVRQVVAEYLEVDPVVARDASISVSAPVLAIDPVHQLESDRLRVPAGCFAETEVGHLRGGAARYSVFRVTFPEGIAGMTVEILAEVNWTDPLTGATVEPRRLAAPVEFARSRENTPQPRNRFATNLVASAWADAVLRDVLRLNLDGAPNAAEALIAGQLHHLERYCRGVDPAWQRFRLLLEGLKVVHEPWYQSQSRARMVERLLGDSPEG